MSWPLVYLSEVVEVMHQGINTAADKVVYAQEGVPIIQSKHLKDRLGFDDAKFLSEADFAKYKSKYVPKEGDILFSNIGTIGKSLVVRGMPEFLFAWNVFVIRPRHDLVVVEFLKRYLDWLLSISYYDKFLTGGTVKFINKKVMEGIEIPLPPLHEQKRIGAILDKADSIRRKRQQATQLADDFLRTVFLDMFGDPLTNPKGWEMKKWSSVLAIVNGRNQKTVEDENGAYPICGSGGFMAKANDWLTEANSIIIGRKGNINSPILMRERFWNVDTAFGLEPKRAELSHNYLFWFCRFFDFERLNKAVTIPSLTKTDLLQIDIPLPPRAAQVKFDEVVERVDMLSAKNEKALSERLFESLSQKAFSGQL